MNGEPWLREPFAGPGPKRHSVGVSLYQVVRKLQRLLALWTGASPTCHRDIPTSIST
jgi:hypothetical protein